MAREWQAALAALQELGASVTFVNRGQPLGEWLLVSLSGSGVGDEVLPQFKLLTPLNLKIIDLGGTRVSDAGLEHLASLRGLWKLRLTGTQVTNEGLQRLTQELTHCEIAR